MLIRAILNLTFFVFLIITLPWNDSFVADAAPPPYRSPYAVAFDGSGGRIAVSDWTAGKVSIADPASGKVSVEVALEGRPAGLVWSPHFSRIFVAENGAGTVAEVDPAAGKVLRRFPVGLR